DRRPRLLAKRRDRSARRLSYPPRLVADNDAWITDHDGVGRYILGNYRSSADHCRTADPHAGQNRGVRTDRCIVLDDCLEKRLGIVLRTRKSVIGEGGIRSDKHAVAESYAVP